MAPTSTSVRLSRVLFPVTYQSRAESAGLSNMAERTGTQPGSRRDALATASATAADGGPSSCVVLPGGSSATGSSAALAPSPDNGGSDRHAATGSGGGVDGAPVAEGLAGRTSGPAEQPAARAITARVAIAVQAVCRATTLLSPRPGSGPPLGTGRRWARSV